MPGQRVTLSLNRPISVHRRWMKFDIVSTCASISVTWRFPIFFGHGAVSLRPRANTYWRSLNAGPRSRLTLLGSILTSSAASQWVPRSSLFLGVLNAVAFGTFDTQFRKISIGALAEDNAGKGDVTHRRASVPLRHPMMSITYYSNKFSGAFHSPARVNRAPTTVQAYPSIHSPAHEQSPVPADAVGRRIDDSKHVYIVRGDERQ